MQVSQLLSTDKVDSVGEHKNMQKTNVTIACSINGVISLVCPIPTNIAGLTIGYGPSAFIFVCDVCRFID